MESNFIIIGFSLHFVWWRRTQFIVMHLWWSKVNLVQKQSFLGHHARWKNVGFNKILKWYWIQQCHVQWLDCEFSKATLEGLTKQKFNIHHEIQKYYCSKDRVVVKLNVTSCTTSIISICILECVLFTSLSIYLVCAKKYLSFQGHLLWHVKLLDASLHSFLPRCRVAQGRHPRDVWRRRGMLVNPLLLKNSPNFPTMVVSLVTW